MFSAVVVCFHKLNNVHQEGCSRVYPHRKYTGIDDHPHKEHCTKKKITQHAQGNIMQRKKLCLKHVLCAN